MSQSLYAPKLEMALKRSYFFEMDENMERTREVDSSGGAALPVAVSIVDTLSSESVVKSSISQL